MNNIQLAVALVLDPKAAIAEIEARPRFLFPLLVTILVSGVLLFWFFNVVDADWLIDRMVRSNPRAQQATEEDLAQAAQFMTPGVIKWTSLIGVVFYAVGARLLEAIWYLLAGKVTKVRRSFKQWFALASWTGLPQVIAALPAIPMLLTADSPQMETGALSPLSLNELIFHRGMGEPGYNLLANINLVHIFTIYLAVLGVKLWSGRSWLFATIYTLLPVAVFLGGWFIFQMVRA